MPTSARMSLGFFGQFADVGIRAPAQNGLLQPALASSPLTPEEIRFVDSLFSFTACNGTMNK